MNRSPDLLRRLAGAAGRLQRGVFAVLVLALLASVGAGALLTADSVDAQIGAQTKRIYLPVAFRNFFREGGGPGPGPAPTPAPTTNEVPKSLFGMYGGSRQQVLVDQIAQFGAGTQRIYVQWNLLQFNQAYSDNNWLEPTELANLDAEIQRVRQAGMQPVLLIGEAPDYASERVRGPLRPGKTDTYLRFLRLMVERYRAQPYDVHHWELWPEPDAVSNLPARYAGRPEFEKRRAWGDNGADYAAMLKAVYPEIKRLDPNAKVLIGALAYDWFAEGKSPGFNAGGIFNYKFINDVIAAGGDCCFDILAFNSYASFAPDWEANTPEPNAKDVAAKAAYIRNELSKLGVNKPLMVLEAGLWSAGSEVAFRLDNGEVATLAPTVDVQAGYVTKLYARSASSKLLAAAWYTLVDGSIEPDKRGLVRDQTQGHAVKKSGEAYAAASSRLTRAMYQGKLPTTQAPVGTVGRLEGYTFRHRNGYDFHVAWLSGAVTGQATFNFPVTAGKSVRIFDMTGKELINQVATGNTFSYAVTPDPVYIEIR